MRKLKTAAVSSALQGRASYAVRVSGDSLEPIYSSGDLLLIEKTDTPQHGDLGIFYPRGGLHETWWLRRYCDKDGPRRLLSLSADVPPVLITKDIIFKGRVLGRA